MAKDLVINNGKIDTTKLVGAPNVRQINYILNADAEVDTSGWATYADAAQATPVDGTGGTAQTDLWIRSTTSPIRGAGSFRLDKTGSATRQGQGASYNFTIDKADQAKVLTVSFDYEVVSGTYATGDLTVYVYDVTNAQVIQPAGFQVEALGSGVQNKLIATFQTASNSTSYRLILHVASASTQNYTLAFDNVTVGPQTVQYGPPITDWQSYTPTFNGFGTPTSVDMYYRRIGDSVQIYGRFAVGTPTAVEARIGLPSGMAVENSDLPKIVGEWIRNNSLANQVKQGRLTAAAGFTYLTFNYVDTATAAAAGTQQTGFNIISPSEVMWINAFVQVQGWGSSVVMSDSTDTRVVSFYANNTSNQVLTAASTLVSFPNNISDSHGAWSGNNTYTVPVPGDYYVNMIATTTTGAGDIYAYVNNVQSNHILGMTNTNQVFNGGSLFRGLRAGDLITLKSGGNCTLLGGATVCSLNIFRLSGPSAIAATESVSVLGSGTISNATYTAATPIRFTPTSNSHSAYSNATGKFTAPVSGNYLVTAFQDIVTGLSAGNNIRLYINDVQSTILGANPSSTYPVGGSGVVRMLAGQTLDFRISASCTLSSASNWYSITRIGNY